MKISSTFILMVIILIASAFKHDIQELKKETKFQNDPGTLHWVQNEGQFDDKIAFSRSTIMAEIRVDQSGDINYFLRTNDAPIKISEHLVETSFKIHPSGESLMPTKVNIIKGGNEKHFTDIKSFGKINLGETWDGVKVELNSRKDNVEKIFFLDKPGDVQKIKLAIEGIDELCINSEGALQMDVKVHSMEFTKPLAWQEYNNQRHPVRVEYLLSDSSNEYGFKLGKSNPDYGLIIDPMLGSTFIGGTMWDFAEVLKVGKSGKIYVGGTTESFDLSTTPSAYEPVFNDTTDAFLALYNPELSILEVCTFIGGAGVDLLKDMALDTSDNVYFTGQTQSEDFPVTLDAYDQSYNNPGSDFFFDAMITSLGPDLKTLRFSTFFGTPQQDYGVAIDIDSKQQVIVTGHTWGQIPQVGQQFFEKTTSCIFFKFDHRLENLMATNSISGDNFFFSSDLVVDSSDNVFIVGDTWATNMITDPYAFSVLNLGKSDIYLFRVDNRLGTFLSGTYLGGIEDDYAHCVITDRENNAYIGGSSKSQDFPIPPMAFDTLLQFNFSPIGDAVICKLDSNLQVLEAATFLGGDGEERAYDLALDSMYNILVTGYTTSTDFPVFCNSFDRTYGNNEDAFISKLDSSLTKLYASTYVGGFESDHSYTIALNKGDSVYIAGYTTSQDFPVYRGADTLFAGGPSDGFVFSINSELDQGYPCCSSILSPPFASSDMPTELLLEWTNAIGASGYNLAISTASGSSIFDQDDYIFVGDTTSFLLTDLPCGDTVFIQVQPLDSTTVNTFCATLWFTTAEPFLEDEHVVICEGEEYFWQGQSLGIAGIYEEAFVDMNGCDSVYRLELSIQPVYYDFNFASVCDDDPYFWQGTFYNQSGIYLETYQTSAGCDSIFELELEVFPSYEFVESAEICEGESFIWGNQELTLPGTYTHNFISQQGCDSLVQLDLSAFPTYEFYDTLRICIGDSLNWQGNNYDTAGNYSVSYNTLEGCDSTYYLQLILYLHSFDWDVIGFCEGEVVHWQGMELDSTGSYTVTYNTVEGCDSIHELSLYLILPETTVSISGDSLIAHQVFESSYQWVTCPDLEPISGANDAIFVADSSGAYAVIVEKEGCIDTSACYSIIHSNSEEVIADQGILLFPNPATKDEIQIVFEEGIANYDIEVITISGKRVLDKKGKGDEIVLPISNVSNGLYLVKISKGDKIFTRKLVISR